MWTMTLISMITPVETCKFVANISPDGNMQMHLMNRAVEQNDEFHYTHLN